MSYTLPDPDSRTETDGLSLRSKLNAILDPYRLAIVDLDTRLLTVTENVQTGSYALVLTDANKAIVMNVGTANTLTVPPNSSVAFPVGTVIEVLQLGAGQTTITPGVGVTLLAYSSRLKLTGQYSTAGLRKRSTNEWVVAGDLST